MSREIKVGDKVKCIDDKYSFNRLRKGDIYVVEEGWWGGPTVIVNRVTHNLDRFELEEEDVEK